MGWQHQERSGLSCHPIFHQKQLGKTMKKLVTLSVLALCLGLFSYGCGGSDKPPIKTDPPAGTQDVNVDDIPTEGDED